MAVLYSFDLEILQLTGHIPLGDVKVNWFLLPINLSFLELDKKKE